MESYKIVIHKSAAKELERIEQKDRSRVIDKIRSLATDPNPQESKQLSGQEKYRIMQGNYRILYQVIADELVISVVRVGHRRDIDKNKVHPRRRSSGDGTALA
ncbi:MAG: mRNA interferase RelE/StbE [Lentimonas sp.]|jgi:mRNA interferase RelE/StbE